MCSCVVKRAGSGKWLTFEIAPFVFSFMHHKDQLPKLTSLTVIVISQLISRRHLNLYAKVPDSKNAAKSTHIIVLTSFIQIRVQTNFIC